MDDCSSHSHQNMFGVFDFEAYNVAFWSWGTIGRKVLVLQEVEVCFNDGVSNDGKRCKHFV